MSCLTNIPEYKFGIEIGSIFSKKLRWKDKFKEPIILTGYSFQSQFRYSDGTLFCDLNIDGSITVDNINGEITLTIPKDKTRELKKFSTGDWSLEYKIADGEFKSLIRGPWDTISEVTI